MPSFGICKSACKRASTWLGESQALQLRLPFPTTSVGLLSAIQDVLTHHRDPALSCTTITSHLLQLLVSLHNPAEARMCCATAWLHTNPSVQVPSGRVALQDLQSPTLHPLSVWYWLPVLATGELPEPCDPVSFSLAILQAALQRGTGSSSAVAAGHDAYEQKTFPETLFAWPAQSLNFAPLVALSESTGIDHSSSTSTMLGVARHPRHPDQAEKQCQL